MNRTVTAALLLSLTGSACLRAQIPLSSLPNATYEQDFDRLAAAGTGLTWENNVTLPGWYLSRATYNADTGASSTVGAYSYGSNADRALGSVAGPATGTVIYAVRFRNDTDTIYPGFNFSFFGEQWRKGNNAVPHRLEFSYKISSAPLTALDNLGFSSFGLLDFVSPTVGATTASALDGNQAPNRVLLEGSLSFSQTLDPGEEILFRWVDVDNGGGDHGLAIDNLVIEVPEAEAGTALFLLLVLTGAWAARRVGGDKRTFFPAPGCHGRRQ